MHAIYVKVFLLLYLAIMPCGAMIFFADAAMAAAQPQAAPRDSIAPLPASPPILQKASPAEAAMLAQNLSKASQGLTTWRDLAPALAVSRAYAESWPQQERAMEHSGFFITWKQVSNSLNLLERLLPELDKKPELLAERFEWLRMNPGPRFTSYYSPVVKASMVRKPGFTHPLYRLPEQIAPELAACLPTHTCPEEAFTRIIAPETPFYNRATIDLDNALQDRKLEMAYVAHPFDAYLLMLEGSGILEFEDGSQRAVLFAGLSRKSEGKSSSMAGYLMRTGQIARKDATINGMRVWWDAASLKKRRALLEACPTYVFFRFGAPEPRGTAGGPLTPWVSMAADPQVLPLGGIVAYSLPSAAKNGLGFAHDTGGAIKMRRIDMYAGAGTRAGDAAHAVNHGGDTWLLLAK